MNRQVRVLLLWSLVLFLLAAGSLAKAHQTGDDSYGWASVGFVFAGLIAPGIALGIWPRTKNEELDNQLEN